MKGIARGPARPGLREGKNLVIEFRRADGKYEGLPELTAALVQLKVDVIVTYSTLASRAAKDAHRADSICLRSAAARATDFSSPDQGAAREIDAIGVKHRA